MNAASAKAVTERKNKTEFMTQRQAFLRTESSKLVQAHVFAADKQIDCFKVLDRPVDAGVLKKGGSMFVRFILFAATVALAAAASTQLLAQAGSDRIRGEVPAAQAAQFIGKVATVCGAVAGTRFAENAEGQPTFLFVGANFPQHQFSVRIWGRDRAEFSPAPDTLSGKTVCASGEIRSANGRPEIVVRRQRDLVAR